MTKYLKIQPDPDSKPCRCGDGNPDCDHFEFCPECGEEYKAHEGHDCIDGVPVQDLRALAKELRDALVACDTERIRLCYELDAAHDGEDALRSEVARLRAQIAALQSVPQGVEVTPAEIDAAWNDFATLNSGMLSDEPEDDLEVFSAGFRAGSARLVPTTPQAAPETVVEIHHVMAKDLGAFLDSLPDVPPEETTPHHPLQPEERRVGPDEVVPWISVDDRLPEDGQSVAFVTKCNRDPFYHGRVLGGRYSAGEFGGFSVPGLMFDASHWLALPPAPDALRTSAQANNGEESK